MEGKPYGAFLEIPEEPQEVVEEELLVTTGVDQADGDFEDQPVRRGVPLRASGACALYGCKVVLKEPSLSVHYCMLGMGERGDTRVQNISFFLHFREDFFLTRGGRFDILLGLFCKSSGQQAP